MSEPRLAVRVGSLATAGLAVALIALLALPMIALAMASSPGEIAAGIAHPTFLPALWLSLQTTLISLALVVATGTPLGWWLSVSTSRTARVVEVVVDLPIVVPPAVVGVALLMTFGRNGLLGAELEAVGLRVPFTTLAVVIAQVVVSAPFYVQGAATAFRKVDSDLLVVARTLGASPAVAFFRVAVPVALPGLLAGATLSWARSIGEFGATLLFAGNLPGTTQTMPLAIYTALESDVRVALAIALVLAGIALIMLLALRLLPQALSHLGTSRGNARRRSEGAHP
jgi:molybdate transport system permease protein